MTHLIRTGVHPPVATAGQNPRHRLSLIQIQVCQQNKSHKIKNNKRKQTYEKAKAKLFLAYKR